VTTLPALRSPLPLVIPGPEAAIEIAVGVLSSLIDTVLLAVPGLPAKSNQTGTPLPATPRPPPGSSPSPRRYWHLV